MEILCVPFYATTAQMLILPQAYRVASIPKQPTTELICTRAALLARVIERLQAECVADGKGKLFEQLKTFLMAGGGDSAQAAVAKSLDMEEGAVRVAIHRLRKRYRALLRDEIANTLADESQVDDEMRALFGAFS